MRFWSRMLHRQCQQKNTLIIHMCPIIRDFTLYGIVPTSFELSIPRLMKDGRVLSASQVRQAHHTQHTGASSSSSSSAAATSLSQLLSYYMSSTFSITTSPQQQLDEVLSDGILLTSVLLTLEKHLVLHTNSLAPKARVHFMPASYVNSSLAQYMRETSTKTHMVSCTVHDCMCVCFMVAAVFYLLSILPPCMPPCLCTGERSSLSSSWRRR